MEQKPITKAKNSGHYPTWVTLLLLFGLQWVENFHSCLIEVLKKEDHKLTREITKTTIKAFYTLKNHELVTLDERKKKEKRRFFLNVTFFYKTCKWPNPLMWRNGDGIFPP